MERRVEDGHVRDVGQRPPRVGQRRERRAVVERRELSQLRERFLDLVVNDDRLAESPAAVHDAMRDGVHVLRKRLHLLCRAVVRDDRELQARRPRVDDED